MWVTEPGDDGSGGQGGSAPENQGGTSGGGGGGPTGPTQGTACSPLAGATNPCDAGGTAPPAPEVVAQIALDSVTFAIPELNTSPGGHQITGIETWLWLDPDQWLAHTARAELPGLWAEVTATPTRAEWDPGDGSPRITCNGPGRPATPNSTTDCGHTYTVIGDYTLTVRVTYAVTWRASNGATGTFDAIVLTDSAPVEVQQRQAVTD